VVILIGSPATSWEGGGRGNSLIVPVVVIFPIWRALNSPNQSAPSGPTVMPAGPALEVGTGNSLMVPVAALAVEAVVIMFRASKDSKSTNRQVTRSCFMVSSYSNYF